MGVSTIFQFQFQHVITLIIQVTVFAAAGSGLSAPSPLVRKPLFLKPLFFLNENARVWISLSVRLHPILLASVGLFSFSKETADTFISFLPSVHSLLSILPTLVPFFLSLSPHPLYFLTPSGLVLLQWVSNWGSVIGREKQLGENDSLRKGKKKGKDENERPDLSS